MATSQTTDLHRALLRPFVIHTLRAAGFHSAKPSALDTLVDLAQRYLMLLATSTATAAWNAGGRDGLEATLADARAALQVCGALAPLDDPAREGWEETMRLPLEVMALEAAEANAAQKGGGGSRIKGIQTRAVAEKRKRDDEDLGDVRAFVRWFDSPAYAEIRRVAGLVPDASAAGAAATVAGAALTTTAATTDAAGPATSTAAATATAGATAAPGLAAVGVGGGVVQAEDFLTVLKKRQGKGAAATGDDSRWRGTVLGRPAEDRSVLLEGGPVQRIRDWKPPRQPLSSSKQDAGAGELTSAIKGKRKDDGLSGLDRSSPLSPPPEDVDMRD